MAKVAIEIEIPDVLARRWSTESGFTPVSPDFELRPDRIGENVASIIAIYGHRPALATDQHKVALGMLRQQMLEKAMALSNPGAGPWSIENLADEFVKYLAQAD